MRAWYSVRVLLRNSAKPIAVMRSLDSIHSICTEIWRSSAGAIRAMKCSDIWADSARVSSVELMAQIEPSTSTPLKLSSAAAPAAPDAVAP